MSVIRILTFAFLGILTACNGDREAPGNGVQLPVLYPGESAYVKFVSSASITPEKAEELVYPSVKQIDRTKVPWHFGPLAVVNRYYLFSEPRKFDTSLRGYYVDAVSGAVRYIDDSRRLAPSEHVLLVQPDDFRAQAATP